MRGISNSYFDDQNLSPLLSPVALSLFSVQSRRRTSTLDPHSVTPLSTLKRPYKIRMGKKSRRPNRNKPKGIPAAAATAVASPRQVITSANDVATFKQLYISQDWEGALELESKMSVIANSMERSNPRQAVIINLLLGHAHKLFGREGGIDKAIVYLL